MGSWIPGRRGPIGWLLRRLTWEVCSDRNDRETWASGAKSSKIDIGQTSPRSKPPLFFGDQAIAPLILWWKDTFKQRPLLGRWTLMMTNVTDLGPPSGYARSIGWASHWLVWPTLWPTSCLCGWLFHGTGGVWMSRVSFRNPLKTDSLFSKDIMGAVLMTSPWYRLTWKFYEDLRNNIQILCKLSRYDIYRIYPYNQCMVWYCNYIYLHVPILTIEVNHSCIGKYM